MELPDEVDKSKEGSSASEVKTTRTTIPRENLIVSGEDIFRTYHHGRLECPSFDGFDFSEWMM